MDDKIGSLIKLLGDDDEVIVKCATRELKKMGLTLLEEWDVLASKPIDYKILKKINTIIEDIQIDAIAKKIFNTFHQNSETTGALFYTLKLIEKYCFIYAHHTPEEVVSDLETLMSINGRIWKFIERDSPLHLVALCHVYFIFKGKSHTGINPTEISLGDNDFFISVFKYFTNDKLLKLLIEEGQFLFLKTKKHLEQIEIQDFFLRNLTLQHGSIYYLLYYFFIENFLIFMGYKRAAKVVSVQSVNHFLNIEITEMDKKINKEFDFFLMIEENESYYLYDYKKHRYNKIKILSAQHSENKTNDSKYIVQINAFEEQLNFVLIEQTPTSLLSFLITHLNELQHNSFNDKLLNRLNVLFQNV